MNPVPELAPQLKQLRLSGILVSLEARNRQAIESKLAFTEFLALLIGDEVARREQKKFSLRLRRAQFRTTKTLEQFDFNRLAHLNRALVHDLATGRYLNERTPVLIVGPCSTGKSHLAQALGHCAVRQGADVVFTTCASLTQSLNAARATGVYERRLNTMARVALLIIDDFGLKPLRPPADEDLHDLRRALRASRHHRHQQPGLRRMGPGLPGQSTPRLSDARPATTQRLLPGPWRRLVPRSARNTRRGQIPRSCHGAKPSHP